MHVVTQLLLCVAVIVLHEAGHIAAAKLLGVKVHSVGVSWRGVYNYREQGTLKQNILIALAGPGLNLLLFLMFYPYSFGLLNLVFGFANLMPFKGSDGWRIKCILL